MAFKLAELFIEIGVKGLGVVKEALGAVQQTLISIGQGASAVGFFSERAFDLMTSSLRRWISAGLQGTGFGNMLGLQIRFLSMQIASLFVPEINKAISGLRMLTEWFRSLSGEQQRSIAHFVEGTVAGLAFAVVVPRVVAAITAAVAAFRLLVTAMEGPEAFFAALLPILGAVAAAVFGLAVGAEVGRTGFAGFLETLKPLGNVLRESLGAVTTALGPLFNDLGDLAHDAIQALVGAVRELTPALAAAAAELAPLGRLFFQTFGPDLVEAIRNVTTVIRVLVQSIGAILHGLNEILRSFNLLPADVARVQRPDEQRTDVLPASRGFESITEAYRRVQVASLKQEGGSMDPNQRTAEAAEKILMEQKAMNAAIGKLKPAIA